MDLFESIVGEPHNLLPKNGTLNYYGLIMSVSESYNNLENLLDKL